MRHVTAVQIDELIVHVVDARQPGGFVLSQRTLPLESSPRLASYFATHILNALRDPSASAARFTPAANTTACWLCAAMLAGQTDLIGASQQLATRLHDIMAKDRRIAPGDLAVCLYRDLAGAGACRYLALIKIDPTEAFRHVTRHDDAGRVYVSFEVESDVLPSTRERLQKCAFVQPPAPGREYDMMVLDRQTNLSPGQPVARFFLGDFLGAELAFDARQRTERLYKGLMAAYNTLHPRLTAAEAEELQRARDAALSMESLNVDAWVEALPLPAPHKRAVWEAIAEKLPDREFALDRSFVEQLTRKRRFRGDDGLIVEASAELWARSAIVTRYQAPPGEPPYTEVVIRTEKWDEVSRR